MKFKMTSLNPARLTGIALLAAAAVVFPFSPLLAAGLAFLYMVLCLMAAFFPQSNFFLPVISRGKTGENFVALTFDDGPSPLTRDLLDLLDRYSAKATFFVSGVNVLKYPDVVGEIIARGHTLGNHSFHHHPFLMLCSYRHLKEEIFRVQEILKEMGVCVFAFRPPVGIVNPKLPLVLDKLGMFCVTFSCRAFDAGNRRVRNLGARILKRVKPDDIILLHDGLPDAGDHHLVIAEAERVLRGLKDRKLKILPLADLIGRDVMAEIPQVVKSIDVIKIF
ncbi:MAG TPA: polysaccharide deacetylase family protein [Smithella sp.]|nr:polysaccharide deacetylase family protein [Smithella sp.]